MFFVFCTWVYKADEDILIEFDQMKFIFQHGCWNSIVRLSSNESVFTCVMMNYELK